MKKAYTQNNFLAYLLVLGTLFIVLFFTKDIFWKLQIALDESSVHKQELLDKEATLKDLNELELVLWEEWSEAIAKIQGFSGDFSDRNMLQYIHSYAESENKEESNVIIRDITLAPTMKSDLWFNKTDVKISAIFSWEDALFNFVNYLINPKSTYRFYISDFNYPMNEWSWNIQVTIPLTLYHK